MIYYYKNIISLFRNIIFNENEEKAKVEEKDDTEEERNNTEEEEENIDRIVMTLNMAMNVYILVLH